MKDSMRKYAFKNRKIKESYLRKHCDGGTGREAYKASRRNSIQRCGEGKEEIAVAIDTYGKYVELTEDVVSNTPLSEDEQLAIDIYTKALKEVASILKEMKNDKSEVGIGQPIQSSRKKRSKVRSCESSGCGCGCGNEEIRKRKDGEASSCRQEEVKQLKNKGKKMKKESKAYEKKEEKKEERKEKKDKKK
jgi:hypothetical protein